METNIFGIVLFVGFLSCYVSIMMFSHAYKYNKYYGCPKYIYNNSQLNIFGVILSSILIFITIPLYYLLWFGYWSFHIRRDTMKKPTSLEEVRQFIYTSLKHKYGNAVLSKSDKDDIVIDTETDYYGNSDVWIKLNYFH